MTTTNNKPDAPARSAERDFRKDYDIHSAELGEHWDQLVADLHTDCPVARSREGEGFWFVLTYEGIRKCAQDWESFSSMDGFIPNRPSDMPFYYPEESDPPFHDELRKVLDPHLSHLPVSELEPGIEQLANQLIDDLQEGENDLVSVYSNILPGMAFCALVAHMPVEDVPYLSRLLHKFLMGSEAEREKAMVEAMEYMDGFVRRRREEEPRGDVVDAILEFEPEKDSCQGIRGEYGKIDQTGTVFSLAVGGLGTSGHVIASAIHYLARNPETRQRLIDDPSLMQRATDEFIRFFAPSACDGRRVTKDVEVEGTKMKAGDYAMLGFALGCRDPRKFEQPNDVRIDRFPNPHQAFGAGPHRCVGAHLARLQIRVAIQQFILRVGEYRLPEDFEPTYEMGILRSIERLPVILDASPRSL